MSATDRIAGSSANYRSAQWAAAALVEELIAEGRLELDEEDTLWLYTPHHEPTLISRDKRQLRPLFDAEEGRQLSLIAERAIQ